MGDFKLVLCLHIVWLWILTNKINSMEPCVTPDQEEGQCISVHDCQYIIDFVKAQRPLVPSKLDYLRNFTCGFEGKEAKVCCPSEKMQTRLATIQAKLKPVEKQCQTPDGLTGKCVSVHDCLHLLTMIRGNKLTAAKKNYLSEFQCGFEDVPKVCCPPKDELPPEILEKRKLLPDRTICGKQASDRIIGGTIADLLEFPWMALLEYEKEKVGRKFLCGGSLINKRYVLTAAHCVVFRHNRLKLLGVRLGEHDTAKEMDCFSETPGLENCIEPVNFNIEEVIPHAGFDPFSRALRHDIALLRLSEDVKYTDSIGPVCLPFEEIEALPRTSLTVAGWGATEDGPASTVKLKVELPLVSHINCSSVYEKLANLTIGEGQLCAGGIKGKDSCRGDSGGPLMINSRTEIYENYFAMGVVSFGISCGIEVPAVYTRVSQYSGWILEHIKE